MLLRSLIERQYKEFEQKNFKGVQINQEKIVPGSKITRNWGNWAMAASQRGSALSAYSKYGPTLDKRMTATYHEQPASIAPTTGQQSAILGKAETNQSGVVNLKDEPRVAQKRKVSPNHKDGNVDDSRTVRSRVMSKVQAREVPNHL